MIRTAHFALLLSALLALGTGCANTGTQTRRAVAGPLDDGLLQFVDSESRERIRAARIDHIEAQDNTAAAVYREKASRSERRALTADVRAAAKRRKEEERRVAQAVRDGSVARAEEYAESVQDATDDVLALERAIALHDAQAEELESLVALETAEEAHAASVVDLFKARALFALGRPDTADIDLALYERIERERETEIELAKTVLRAAQREMHIAQSRMESPATASVGVDAEPEVEAVTVPVEPTVPDGRPKEKP